MQIKLFAFLMFFLATCLPSNVERNKKILDAARACAISAGYVDTDLIQVIPDSRDQEQIVFFLWAAILVQEIFAASISIK